MKKLRLLTRNPINACALAIVGAYAAIALLSWIGWIPLHLSTSVEDSYLAPGAGHWLGNDLLGRDVLSKVIYGARIAFSVGFVASMIAIPIGAILGIASGYFGGRFDQCVVWFYSMMVSIPQILLLTSLSFVLGKGLTSIYLAVGLTSWVGICRLTRAEVMKLKSSDYVLAARSVGVPSLRLLIRHILPNVSHLLIVDFSLRFVYAIKSEAILSYLGLGVQGEPSWGIMISDAKEELMRGIWWQLAAATCAMFLIVLALNLLGDALRDLFDPKTAET